jgi:uncharacterized membrane protein HdeD (DUF308 family)
MSQLRMREQIGSMADRINPLKERTHWGVVVAEGVVLLILGIFVLTQRQLAGAGLVQLIGGYLFVTSAIAVYGLIAGTGEPASSPGRWVRVGIGLIIGLIALAHPWIGTIDTAAAATVLAIGLLLVGIIGLYAAIATSQSSGWRWDQVLLYAVYLVLGGMVLYRNFSGTEFRLLPVIGWFATLGGPALCGYGVWIYRQRSQQLTAASATASSAATQATDAMDGAPSSDVTTSATAAQGDAAATTPAPPATSANNTAASSGAAASPNTNKSSADTPQNDSQPPAAST